MLELAEALGYSDTINCLKNGRSFRITDVDELVHRIVPQFFRQTQIRSFTRQLCFGASESHPTTILLIHRTKLCFPSGIRMGRKFANGIIQPSSEDNVKVRVIDGVLSPDTRPGLFMF